MGYGYLVVIQDNASDNYSCGIPEEEDSPQTIFTTYEGAKAAVEAAASKFEQFQRVAYGKAFPYDDVTFEQQLEKKSFAPYGWGLIVTEDETLRIYVGILRMKLSA